jgi:hypothetical protein
MNIYGLPFSQVHLDFHTSKKKVVLQVISMQIILLIHLRNRELIL